MATCFVLQKP